MDPDIDDLIRKFAQLLDGAAPFVISEAPATSAPDEYWENWIQANWELFVEARLRPGLFLEIYGPGADFHDRSSRVSYPDATPTHSVVCSPKAGKAARDVLSGTDLVFPEAGLPLEELVTIEGTWYERHPPFDHVLVEIEDEPHVFDIDDVTFGLGPPTGG